MIKLFPSVLFEKYVFILALEMASPGNQHCAKCIGTLSFPIELHSSAGCRVVRIVTLHKTCCSRLRHVSRYDCCRRPGLMTPPVTWIRNPVSKHSTQFCGGHRDRHRCARIVYRNHCVAEVYRIRCLCSASHTGWANKAGPQIRDRNSVKAQPI